jgi:predicted secreted protein
MSTQHVWMIAMSLFLVVGCSSEPTDESGEQRGVISDPGPLKADSSNSCKSICGKRAPSKCWCDDACEMWGDCCPDHRTVCVTPKDCTGFVCSAGYHCEMKGINGGAVPACIKDASSALQVTETDDGKTLAAQLGGTVELRLGGNPTTGYEWKLTSASKGLPLASSDYVADQPMLVGSGGTYVFLFDVAASGTYTLELSYARSWEPQPLKTFTVTITVP